MGQFGGRAVEGAPVADEGEEGFRRRAVVRPGPAPQAPRREAEGDVVGDGSEPNRRVVW